MAGGGEEPLGLGGIVAVVLRALAELRDRQRPVASAAGSGPLMAPTPSNMESIWPLRSMAREMACRTRTSLNGGLSARMKMSFMTLDGNSAVWRPGGRFLSGSAICTQSVRLIVPGNSQPRSYLPPRNAAMREALSSSTSISTRSM